MSSHTLDQHVNDAVARELRDERDALRAEVEQLQEQVNQLTRERSLPMCDAVSIGDGRRCILLEHDGYVSHHAGDPCPKLAELEQWRVLGRQMTVGWIPHSSNGITCSKCGFSWPCPAEKARLLLEGASCGWDKARWHVHKRVANTS